jgi:hypothetical protein
MRAKIYAIIRVGNYPYYDEKDETDRSRGS